MDRFDPTHRFRLTDCPQASLGVCKIGMTDDKRDQVQLTTVIPVLPFMSENVLPYLPIKFRIAKKGNRQCFLKNYAKKPGYQEIPVLTDCSSLA